jgi:acetyl esterase/lipase
MRIRQLIAMALLPIIPVAAQTSHPSNALGGFESTGGSSPYGDALVKKDVPYVANPHVRQTFDIYLPKTRGQGTSTLIYWLHGGAWMLSNKDWDNVKYLVKHGYALASVDYRLSGDAVFPSQIQDCNAALDFILAHADAYGIDAKHFVIGGASAGGHLALLLGLARNEKAFGANPSHKPFAILDFFGPTDLTTILDEIGPGHGHQVLEDAQQRLLGSLTNQLDVTRAASPINYVSHGNPPVLILHGDKDDLVPYSQSQRLHLRLDEIGVKNVFITVPGAGHDGPMFETPDIQEKVISFLHESACGGK